MINITRVSSGMLLLAINSEDFGYPNLRGLSEEQKKIITDKIGNVPNVNVEVRDFILIQKYALGILEDMYEVGENTDDLDKDIYKAIDYACVYVQCGCPDTSTKESEEEARHNAS